MWHIGIEEVKYVFYTKSLPNLILNEFAYKHVFYIIYF